MTTTRRFSVLEAILAVVAKIDPAARAVARAHGLGLSRYPRLAVIVQAVRDPFSRAGVVESEGLTGQDYTTNPVEVERHRLATKLLDRVRDGASLGRVLEIACAEGVFTEMLAPHCDALLSVDFSATALAQARRRCGTLRNVSFGLWDVRKDLPPDQFDVTVVMDVLTLIRRPARLRAVIEKLVANLRPDDLLFVGDYRWKKFLEDSRLGRHLLFGGKWVLRELASHPQLETVEQASTETHVFAVFRKR